MSAPPLTLHQFPPLFGRNASPFALKLETWLRLAGIPYRVVETRNPRSAPKGKIPFIEDDGQRIGDSALIIEHLERTRGISLDDGLDPLQRAEALALRRMLEEHFYFVMAYARWIDPTGRRSFGGAIARQAPAGLGNLMMPFASAYVGRLLKAQGVGRHGRQEVYAMGRADLEALSSFLDHGPLFFHDRPTLLDVTAYAFLANLLLVPVETELKRIAEGFANLGAFCKVMEQLVETTSGARAEDQADRPGPAEQDQSRVDAR